MFATDEEAEVAKVRPRVCKREVAADSERPGAASVEKMMADATPGFEINSSLVVRRGRDSKLH